MKQPISIQAIFNKATTTIDGGWRISFDVAFTDSDKITELVQYAQETLNLVIMTDGYVNKTNKNKS